MKLATSFTGTRGLRFPAPDVSRGLMLLFIALANIPFWTIVTRSSVPGDAVDTAWLWLRTLLVDHRAYPLFSLLFGFGLATMVNRRIAFGTQSYLQSLPGVEAGREPTPQEEFWAREQATVDARRLVRRRGAWMILFGAAHAALFSGDIIGTYGLAAVVFAGWLTRKHRKRAMAVSAVVTAATISTMYTMGSHVAAQGLTAAAVMKQGAGESATTLLSYVSGSITSWAGNSVATVLFSMVVPAMFLGARLADTDLIAHPERHRRLLTAVGLGGLGIGAAGGIGYGLWATGGTLAAWTAPLHEVTGLAGACGWLALLALYAGGPRTDGRLTGLRKLASNVGRRSMTAYLSQSFLFAIIFLALPALTGIELHLGEARAAGIAAAVWLATVGLCAALERGGHAGPFETLLRTAVARSERRRRLPAAPVAVASTDPVATPDAYDLVH
ncbi:DUF418 domain-containing protein [Actinomyces johnsonii]|uniref:DUF418 domain-containing protein n=1 Tax=Actinomyces johnsonii TaxID=544581 RepID=UPI003F8DFFBD